MDKRTEKLASCGVYCAACPSFNKTCLGCASEDRNQKRKSKWGCRIRKCCYEQKHLDYCAYCDDFPCGIYRKKLLNTHAGDPRFTYRFEILSIFPLKKQRDQNNFWHFKRNDGRANPAAAQSTFIITRATSVVNINLLAK
jgi:hypothetical protein